MPLMAEDIIVAWTQFKDATLTETEAWHLAHLYGDREEMVAALILKEDALAAAPHAKLALAAAARRAASAPQLRKVHGGDLHAQSQAQLSIASRLSEFAMGEQARCEAANLVHEALASMLSAPAGTHWIFAPERSD